MTSTSAHRTGPSIRIAWAIAGAAAPALLSYNVPPSPTFWNQALAIAFWGWFAAACAPPAGARWRGGALLQTACALVAAGVCWSWLPGALPPGLALSAIGLLVAAAVLALAGAATQARSDAAAVFGDFCVGFVAAGVCNVAVALLQVFAPDLCGDGDVLACSGIPGRAVGNLRQPNHLSSLMLWSTIAVVALVELRRVGRRTGAVLLAAFVFAVVLTASRTGGVSVALLAVWGALDRRLSRQSRLLLVAAPLVYAVSWLGMFGWAQLSDHTFGGAARLAERDFSASRWGIWKNTFALIAREPWTGVGFGEFNFAWTLTPFPGRPVAFFDHTHDLPLQLVVELGLPLGLLVTGLLVAALVVAARRAWRADGDAGTARRAAWVMVLMIGLHSMVEYPLWYAYFLLPAAFAFGHALGLRAPASAAPALSLRGRAPALVVAGVLLVIGAIHATIDYGRVTSIFASDEGEPSLARRIEIGRCSVYFAHHADYAAATTDVGAGSLAPFAVASHFLLDTRLMVAWARALAAHGRVDEARFIAARLREFHNANSDEFFAECDADPAAFQCTPPTAYRGWRSFIGR